MKKLFNDNWLFQKQPLGTDISVFQKNTGWLPVDIPHDWMIYDAKNLYEEAISCYKKIFTLTNEEKNTNIFLRFEGVYMDTTIYLNGEEFFIWKYGYSTFDIDLTGHLKDGENEILVKTVYQLPNSRWYPGSGIYRNVWLITKPDTYFALDGSYLSTEKLGETWKVFADIEITSSSEKAAVVRHIISDQEGRTIAKHENEVHTTNGTITDTQSFAVITPHVWDIDDPYLYSITSELIIAGTTVDTYTQNLGFRTFSFDAKEGFFLNERHVIIKGACQHHDLGSLGAAMNKEALRRQFTILKEMGVNSIRTAHNMPAVEVMELADEMGILIYSESFDMWERPKTDYDYGNYFNEWWERDLTSWVRRDRNHPSLIIWGIGNEVYDTVFDRGLEITKMLHHAVRKLDPRKNGYTAIGSNHITDENAQRCSDVVDLSGYNYSENLYDEHHEKYPDWCIFGSETSSTVQSRGIYHFPADNRILTTEDLQCSSLFNCTTNWGAKDSYTAIRAHRNRKYVIGQYLWAGWDYIGEPTPYFTKNSFFGQIDTAGFPKDSFYAYQAEWTDYKLKPMVHLLPYWDFNEGQLIDVMVTSNAPKVELFFQDKSMGSFDIDHENGEELLARWQIPYEQGTLRAVAYDENGTMIATDVQSSFGDSKQICLCPNKTILRADGQDLIFLTITTKDDNGVYVANARNRMNIQVSGAGRLIGLDNGDSTDFDQYKGTSRKLFSGKLLAIIAAKDYPGDVKIKVSSPSLETAELTLQAIEADAPAGISCHMENKPSPENSEIPVRKIELTRNSISHLDEKNTSAVVKAEIFPANATLRDITFKALTREGVESNCVHITQEGNTATLKALGDGYFRLFAFANNGLDHPEVMSELEFDISGLGAATLDPYSGVSAILHSESNFPLSLSFQGGVYITTNERTYIAFENVDFGDYGSNEVALPIFSFSNQVPVELWDGIPEKGGRMLMKEMYEAKSWYNHYQENIYHLKERIKGVHTITVVVEPDIKMSLKGFRFTYFEKAFGQLFASENTRITGDMFRIGEKEITDIGNNVTIEYENMNFGNQGCTSITICGRSQIETNTIHIHFIDNDGSETNQIIEIPYSEHYEEHTYTLEKVTGKKKVNLIFLPGSKFNLNWFRFSN